MLMACLRFNISTPFSLETDVMLKEFSIVVTAAAAVMLMTAAPTLAKKKPKKAEKTTTSEIISQPKCTGMKTMHWDDATQTCQKNK
jgi:hypothetical protein